MCILWDSGSQVALIKFSKTRTQLHVSIDETEVRARFLTKARGGRGDGVRGWEGEGEGSVCQEGGKMDAGRIAGTLRAGNGR